jgi:amino acid transporter
MGIAVGLVFFSAFLPILIGTGASKAPWSEWTDGYFVTLGKEIVGPWLSYWLMLASALTNIGMFEAEMSSDSWQIAGMADRGILPSFLGKRNAYDTPTYGILLSASGIMCLCWLSFSEVIDMLNLLFCFGQAIEFFAFLYLRVYKDDMPRPYRIPLGTTGCILMTLFPLLFIGVIIYFSSFMAFVVSTSLTLFGVVLYYMLEYAKKQGWCGFEDRFAEDSASQANTSMNNLHHNNKDDDSSI